MGTQLAQLQHTLIHTIPRLAHKQFDSLTREQAAFAAGPVPGSSRPGTSNCGSMGLREATQVAWGSTTQHLAAACFSAACTCGSQELAGQAAGAVDERTGAVAGHAAVAGWVAALAVLAEAHCVLALVAAGKRDALQQGGG